MKQTEYLYNNYYEATPAWLLDMNIRSSIPWKEFFGSRTVFYPGSGTDPYTVNAFTRSHSAHCFVNVDYHFTKGQINEELERMFPGYSIVYQKDMRENLFMAMFRQPYSYIADFNLFTDLQDGPFEYHPGLLRDFDTIRHFVKFIVFERIEYDDNSHAVNRFALLYIGGDAFPVFNALYANKNANLFALLIEDYGYGCLYARFHRKGLLHAIAQRTNTWPELILTSRCTYSDLMWDGFEYVEGIDDPENQDLGHGRRSLFKRCIPPQNP